MAASKALPCQWTPILPLYTVRSPLPPAIAVASSGAAINDGFCYFCILQTDISSSAYLETFADLRLGVPKRPYITKSIQMAESDGPLKVEDQIRRVPILRLLDCKKRRYIEPLYTRPIELQTTRTEPPVTHLTQLKQTVTKIAAIGHGASHFLRNHKPYKMMPVEYRNA